MSIHEDLDFLTICVPAVPKQVATVMEKTAAYLDHVGGLVDWMERKLALAETLLEGVQEVLDALEASGKDQKTTLETALTATQTAVTGMLLALGRGQQALQDEAEQAVNALTALTGSVATLGAQVEFAQGPADQQIAALGKTVATDYGELEQAVSPAGDAAERLVSETKEANAEAGKAMAEFTAKVDLIEDHVPQHLRDIRTALDGFADKLEGKVQDAMQELTKRNADVYTAAHEGTEPTREAAAKILDDMVKPVNDLEHAILPAVGTMPSDRESAVVPGAQQVTRARTPLPDMVESARLAEQQA
jgi:uncharacterized protein YoxC